MAKKMVCVLALALGFALSVSVQAQDQHPKASAGAKSKPHNTTTDKGPSLDETMNWIVNSLSVAFVDAQRSPEGNMTRATYAFSLTRIGTCSLHLKEILTTTFNDSPTGAPNISEYDANLANLDPTSVTVKPSVIVPPPGWMRESQEPVALFALTTNNGRLGLSAYYYSDLANRGKTALIHAIELCGGKKSAF